PTLRRTGRGQISQQPLGLHTPVPVLAAVEQDHRDPVPVLGLQVRVGVDVDHGPLLARLLGHAGQGHLGHIAQGAVDPGEQREPWAAQGSPPSMRLRTLPVAECGNCGTNSMTSGHLTRARLRSQWATRSSVDAATPSARTTYALTARPVYGCSTPTTA